jgi:hypothetical protein
MRGWTFTPFFNNNVEIKIKKGLATPGNKKEVKAASGKPKVDRGIKEILAF